MGEPAGGRGAAGDWGHMLGGLGGQREWAGPGAGPAQAGRSVGVSLVGGE